QIERELVQAAHLGGVLLRIGKRIANLLDARPGVAAAGGLRLALPAAVVVEKLVPRDAAHPAAEAAGVQVAELLQARRDGEENFLHDVVGVVLAGAAAAAPVKDERAVQARQLLPGVLVVGPD